MDLSPELTVAIVSVCGVIIAAILRLAPSKKGDNSNKKLDVVHKRIDDRQLITMCDEKHKSLDEKMDRIENTGLKTNSIVMEILGKVKL